MPPGRRFLVFLPQWEPFYGLAACGTLCIAAVERFSRVRAFYPACPLAPTGCLAGPCRPDSNAWAIAAVAFGSPAAARALRRVDRRRPARRERCRARPIIPPSWFHPSARFFDFFFFFASFLVLACRQVKSRLHFCTRDTKDRQCSLLTR